MESKIEKMNSLFVEETNSTNDELARRLRSDELPEGFYLWAGSQTAGRGQQNNVWISEKGQNILASLLLRPWHIDASKQFLLSQIVSLGIKQALERYVSGVEIKWPNDIFVREQKMAGILIENSVQGTCLRRSIVGMGINVNQTVFTGDFHAVSLRMFTGTEMDCRELLAEVIASIMTLYRNSDAESVRREYMRSLYRKEGYHSYEDSRGVFRARICAVADDGQLVLEDQNGEQRGYYMKEVRAVTG